MSPSVEQQIARVYKPAIREGLIMVTVVSVQQQEGATDCGLFSIAFAYHAVLEENLGKAVFDQQLMRTHLINCLEAGILSDFPRGKPKKHVTRSKTRHLFIHVHCTCQMPESYDDKMIQCEQCSEWFHFKCVSILSPPQDSW